MTNLQILQLIKARTILFVFIFTALSVAAPLVLHYFGGVAAGRTFLPMHFFVIVAGLFLGWRSGLAVGLFAPLISFLVSGMPLFNILPFVLIETALYGFMAGSLRELFKFNLWLSLFGALIFGRIFLWFLVFISPSQLIASKYVIDGINNGWPGILIQIIFAPFVAGILFRFSKDEI